MQTRTYHRSVVKGILDGERPARLVALLDGASEREAGQQAAHDSPPAPEMYFTRGRRARRAAYWHMWETVTPSQRALAASKHADETPGGDPWRYRKGKTLIDKLVRKYGCSRRLILMAKKLRASGSKPLLRAVAAGTIGLGDALAHVDRDPVELRKAIKLVEQHKARSLRQALA